VELNRIIPLPPKRFQNLGDSAYDPIRFRPWFRLLETRRKKIPILAEAHRRLQLKMGNQGKVALDMGVSDRELRDYSNFIEKRGAVITRTQQQILDEAYDLFCYWRAETSLSSCIKSIAKLYGVNPRHVNELWEVDPFFYPSKVKNL
jgi:hypothetical protein